MITEIPTAEDFARTALGHLHLAWDIGIDIVTDIERAELADWDTDREVTDQYWRVSQPALANAVTLLQQAHEFAIKGRIAAVSPFLLISREARDWPRRCDREDMPFSAFRMADAADLPKLHDTVAPTRLLPEFHGFYEEVRRLRNVIMHVGSGAKAVDPAELLRDILRTHKLFFREQSWGQLRRAYLNNDRIAVAYSADRATATLLPEFETVVGLLKPAECRELLGFDKRARRYLCPHCLADRGDYGDDMEVPLAQLRPNGPKTTQLYCLVCNQTTSVKRERCGELGCRSNVLLDQTGIFDVRCLLCNDRGPPEKPPRAAYVV